MIDEYFKLGHRFVNAERRIWIGCTIAVCAWLMAAGSACALTDPLSSVDARPPGPYPVGCSDVAQNFALTPSDDDRGNYWEGTSIGGQGHYVTQLLVEPQGTLIYNVDVPDVRGLFTTFAGQPVPYAAIVCYPTSADNTRPDYPYDAALTKFVPKMQRGSEPPLWADANARYPVLLYSHGLSGSPLSGEYLQTITSFASYGYVVVAPFHGDGRFADVSVDGLADLVKLFFSGEFREVVELQAIRPLSLQSALDALLADPNYRNHVDAERVAGFGVSIGGESLLLFSGAQLTTDFFPRLQSTQVISDARIKAIAGYVPYFGQRLLPAFGDDQNGVDGMTVPFLGIVGTADTTAPILLTEQGVNRMQGARYAVAFDGLTHDLLLVDLPDIYTWTLTFLDAYLHNSAAARAQIARMNEVKGGAADTVHIDYTPPLAPANGEQIVVEFYNDYVNRFFLTAYAQEASAIDQGAAGPGWRRTGLLFKAYGNEAVSGHPVCRFQSPGSNSHFYTIDAGECQLLASSPAWISEGHAFRALLPSGGVCPPAALPVYRAVSAADHRYTTSRSVYAQLQAAGWVQEGVGFCVNP